MYALYLQTINANPSLVPSEHNIERLDILNLLNLAQISAQLESQAKTVFASKYNMLRLLQNDYDQITMRNILKVFGSSIQSLRIEADKNIAGDALFNEIIESCSSKLKELNLYKFNFQADSLNVRLPFPKLKELGFGQCSGNLNLSELIDNCSALKIFWLEECNLQGIDGMIRRQFKKLERFCLAEYADEINKDALENFIISNPALKALRIDARYSSTHAIRVIGQNMLGLKELNLDLSIDNLQHFQNDVVYIAQLRSLKALSLNFNGREVAPLASALASNNVPIKNFYIGHGAVDGIAIERILQLKQINTLELRDIDGFTEEHLIAFAKSLPELRNMHLTGLNVGLTPVGLLQTLRYAENLRNLSLDDWMTTGCTINTDDYKAMVDIVKNRPKKVRLCIDIYCKTIKVNVPESILLEYREILSIN